MAYRPELVHIARTAKPLGATPAKAKASTRTKRRGPNPLSDAVVALIKRDLRDTWDTHRQIAARYGASIYQVQNIKWGNCYVDVAAAPPEEDQ